MQITNTLYQSPNTIIYEGLPTSSFDGYYKEIVIAERWGYRVVMCATYFDNGYSCIDLYRVEQLRKLSEDDKKLVGVHWTAYGVYDPCKNGVFYTRYDAMNFYAEKIKVKEHNTFTRLDDLLDTELETINFFESDKTYCNDCALHALFGGSKFFALQSLRTYAFKDIDGFSYGINHETSSSYADSDQYEDGLNCSECDTELVPALETYDEDEEVTGINPDDIYGNYDQQAPANNDSI